MKPPRWSSNAAIVAALLALVALCASLLPHLRPSSEAVRLRNALLFQSSAPGDFDWTPEQVPPSFAVDRALPASSTLVALGASLRQGAASDWEAALRIGGHLVSRALNGGAAQSDLEGTFRIIQQGGGYCADYTTVFIAMARAAGLFAREWAFSFDGYGGHGHALVEVWDAPSRQWRMLDVFNNFYVTDRASGRPLSALEFRRHVQDGSGEVAIHRIAPGRSGFRDNAAMYAYYRAGADQWYLWWGNAVYAYDGSLATRAFGSASRSLEQLAAVALGVHPTIRPVPSASNTGMRDAMQRLHWRLIGTGIAGTALAVLLAMQALSRWRHWRRSHA
jgi:hypothetical protein